MAKPTLNGKVLTVAVFFLFASSFALFWLVSIFVRPHDVLGRVGFLCTVLCSLGGLILSWSVSFACLARKRNWSLRTCLMAGFPLGAAGLLVFFLVSGSNWNLGTMLICSSALTGYIARRLVYPELTDEQAVSPKPLTLFPK